MATGTLPSYIGHEFEALRVTYEQQVQNLRAMTDIDLQVFTGIMTVQLVLGGWDAEHPLGNFWLKFGFLTIDVTVVFVAAALLVNNYRRRKEVVETLEKRVSWPDDRRGVLA